MKNKGFTLVELLAVIAILAILVIIALPNVLKMYNDSKKNAFMTEAQNLAKEVSSKYISESMKGNKIAVISNKQNPLDMTGRELEYSFELDSQGKIKSMWVSNGTYCISTNKDYTKISRDDISDKCSYNDLYKTVGTLKNKFYEESGRTDRSLVSSIVFYSDGRTVSGAESYDVSEKKDGSIKMYVSQNSENTSLVDLTIVANGKIAFPEDSSSLFAFYNFNPCYGPQTNLKEILFNDSVDTTKTSNMQETFRYDLKLEVLDLSSFDTSNVTNMYRMFNALETKSLDLSNFNTSNVVNMGYMFANSQAIEIKGLNKFNTSNVTDMSEMFSNSETMAIDLSSFNTSNVTDMSGMFRNSAATEIKGLNKFNTSKVTSMNNMFSSSKATTLDLSNFNTSNVVNMGYMFANSQAIEIKGLNKFNTSKVTSMNNMFSSSKATTLDLSNFNTSNVVNMGYMFANSQAIEIKGLNKFNTSKVTSMNNMFSRSKATTLDLNSFNTSNVTDMSYMFYNSAATTLDLSSFDPSKVTNMSNMFNSSKATTGYARTQADADKFNNSSNKPSSLTFVVK